MFKLTKQILATILCVSMLMGSILCINAENTEVELTDETIELYGNSYDILYDRITDRGYAITSLTGTYYGMFTRDSAIQAMAHISYGDSESARKILRYLLSYHVALGLERGTHIIDNIKDEEYRNNYLSGKGEQGGTDFYEEQTSTGVAQFLITAPNNASATPFSTKDGSITSVQAYLEGPKGGKVHAEIYSDLKDSSTLVGETTYTLSGSSAAWHTITFDNAVSVTPGKTYYLKLYAESSAGRVVWYGISGDKIGYMKAWNYDKNAYGGDGWQEVGVYTAFIIGEGSQSTSSADYNISQRIGDTGIYIITAPNNGAAQAFIPKNDRIYSVDVHLNKSGDNDTVKALICTDYKDVSTAVAEATYTFGKNASGWQNIVFDTPATVTPGKTYYLVLQATETSGKVIWNGTTNDVGSLNSYNYDVGAIGGWAEKPYALAYEIVSYPGGSIAQGFTARGNTIAGVNVDLFVGAVGGKVKVEIRTDYTDSKTAIATGEATLDKLGEQTVTVSFAKALNVQYENYYYVVVTLEDTKGYVKVLTDAQTPETSYAYDNGWKKVGYSFLAEPSFEVDKAPIITLEGKNAGVQEIPTAGELVTGVEMILSKDKNATGTLKATLYKGYGTGAQKIDTKRVDIAALTEEGDWITIKFDLPLTKTQKNGNYYIKLETENATGNVYWCGSTTVDNYETFTEDSGKKTSVEGEASFEALTSKINLISNYTQTDANYMLIHAWVMFVNNNDGTAEDLEFIEQSYPVIAGFANYYIDKTEYFNSELNLLYNPSLEHSRKIQYWCSYDLLTNVFASQALHELSIVASQREDASAASKWSLYAKRIEKGITDNLITEVDGKTIYGEFYDVNDNMKFYKGISWVNLAPIAAEWYAMDMDIMKNTYEIYKKYASVNIYGDNGLATEATLVTNGNTTTSTELTREFIGKGIAWELMFCDMIGDTERMAEILALELETAKRNNISVYPEFWRNGYVTDPGNQEHCSWQFYAMSRVFPQLTKAYKEENEIGFAGYQMGENGIRFVGYTNSLGYDTIDLEITVTGSQDHNFSKPTTTVFKTLMGTTGGTTQAVATCDANVDAPIKLDYGYLYGYAVTDIPAGSYTFTIVPIAIRGDAKITGEQITLNVTVGAAGEITVTQ